MYSYFSLIYYILAYLCFYFDLKTQNSQKSIHYKKEIYNSGPSEASETGTL
jgi:hypothetical protein